MSLADCSKLKCCFRIAFSSSYLGIVNYLVYGISAYNNTSEQFKNYTSLKARRHFTKLLFWIVNKSCKVRNSKDRFAVLMRMIVSC